MVIKLSNDFNNISLLSDDIIIAGSAVSDKALSEFAMENSFGGFEFLSCIPGTVGGGIKMNAGCFEREFKDILVSIQAINKSGQVITIPTKDINFRYRDSGLSDDLIFLSASFRGFKKNNSLIKDEMNNLKEKKELAQPTKIKTSGSTFKNPLEQSDKKVWQLIKESVSLNKSFGDAHISEKQILTKHQVLRLHAFVALTLAIAHSSTRGDPRSDSDAASRSLCLAPTLAKSTTTVLPSYGSSVTSGGLREIELRFLLRARSIKPASLNRNDRLTHGTFTGLERGSPVVDWRTKTRCPSPERAAAGDPIPLDVSGARTAVAGPARAGRPAR